MRPLTGSLRVVSLAIASLVLVGMLGQQADEVAAAGSRVAPPAGSARPRLGAVVLNPASVAGGTAVDATVTLVEPAPPNGAMVTMLSSDPKVAAVPGKVVVPAGASSASFVVRTSDKLAAQTTVDISAQLADAQPATARLVVMPPPAGGPAAQTPAWDLKKNQKK
jgi:hypothetical protein